ncbi:MAG: helix-turn-helix domain-containing protein [Rhodospirillaceae bacterium]|nr:helix-turn-helix domain-containing protein [Rhodospirillaceae bacterium]
MRQALHVKDYVQRLNRVTGYIFDHLDEPLDLLKLSGYCLHVPLSLAPVISAPYRGNNCRHCQTPRSQRAAAYLAHTDLSIAAIATKSGYPNLQSFNRLFKEAYRRSPAQSPQKRPSSTISCFRKMPKHGMITR